MQYDPLPVTDLCAGWLPLRWTRTLPGHPVDREWLVRPEAPRLHRLGLQPAQGARRPSIGQVTAPAPKWDS